MVRGRPEPDPRVVERLGSVARALPGAHEEHAWTGVRWRIRTRTFAHVSVLDESRSVRYSPSLGEVTVVSFRSSGEELLALENAGPPFFLPGWAPSVVVMVLDETTDWAEVAELVTESYRLMAPARLARQLDGG